MLIQHLAVHVRAIVLCVVLWESLKLPWISINVLQSAKILHHRGRDSMRVMTALASVTFAVRPTGMLQCAWKGRGEGGSSTFAQAQ